MKMKHSKSRCKWDYTFCLYRLGSGCWESKSAVKAVVADYSTQVQTNNLLRSGISLIHMKMGADLRPKTNLDGRHIEHGWLSRAPISDQKMGPNVPTPLGVMKTRCSPMADEPQSNTLPSERQENEILFSINLIQRAVEENQQTGHVWCTASRPDIWSDILEKRFTFGNGFLKVEILCLEL